MPSKTGEKVISGVGVSEEAIHTLRFAPMQVLACYYIGTLPFVTGLLTYWAAMSQSPTAYEYHAIAALGLAILFVWMKTWQARFATLLHTHIISKNGGGNAPWGMTGFLRSACRQAFLQATGIIILPMSGMLILPYAWVHAFYQNLTVLDDGQPKTAKSLLADAMRQASCWPRQNIILIWLLSPLFLFFIAIIFLAIIPFLEQIFPNWLLGLVYAYIFLVTLAFAFCSPIAVLIFLNLAAFIAFGAFLLKTFMGIETIFSLAPAAMFNSTFFAFLCGFTYLLLDPVLKTAYVLRCFYSRSAYTGEDIRVKLNRLTTAVLVLAALLSGVAGFGNATGNIAVYAAAPVDAVSLDESLEEVIQQRHFQWRMPRDIYKNKELNLGPLEQLVKWVVRTAKWFGNKIAEWIEWIFGRDFSLGMQGAGMSASFVSMLVKILLTLLVGLLVGMLVVLVMRHLKRRASQPQEATLSMIVDTPNLEDETTTADALPEEEWLGLANQLIAEGKLRLATRAFFFAGLARLAHHELIQVARYKTNFDYFGELRRYAHVHPGLLPHFRENISLYESVWYGDHPVTEESLAKLRLNQEALRVNTHE